MSQFNLVSDGTVTLYDRVFTNFADDDISAITFPNDLVTVKTGKNGNSIFAKNEIGRNATAVLRLIRGSSDDQFLATKLAKMKNDFVSTQLAYGQFTLRMGDGSGETIRDVYKLKGGVITRIPDGKENVSGDTTQGVSIYTIMFADADRGIE
jgi:hypothetical protein